MRRIIAALQVSLDGLIEGPNGELDWVDSWEDNFGLLAQIDACILGRVMYAGYQHYWRSILADPGAVLEFSGKPATQGEIAYANFADKIPHYVLSKSLAEADWKNTRIVRDIEEIRRLKMLPGKDMHAVGGARLVSSLLNAGLIDELRLIVHPLVLGKGMPLFKDIKERQALTLLDVTPLQSGLVRLKYSV